MIGKMANNTDQFDGIVDSIEFIDATDTDEKNQMLIGQKNNATRSLATDLASTAKPERSQQQRTAVPKYLSIRKSLSNKQSNLDYTLSLVGSFGLYQKLQFVLVGFLAIVPSMAAYAYVFIAATPQFTCVLASEKHIVNYDDNSLLNSINKEYDKNSWNDNQTFLTESIRLIRIIDRTKTSNESFYDNSCQITIPNQNKTSMYKNKRTVLKCLEWLYDDTIYGRTIVTDWNLVCLKSYFKALTQNAYIMGTACSIISGIISDKLGRKTAMMLMITLMAIVLSFTQLLMHQADLGDASKITILTISRFFQGFGQTMYSVSFVLLMEITGPKHRVFAGNIMAYSFGVGQLVLCGLAYYLRDWRKIMWALTVYVIPFFTYYWLVPESPRWLLSKDKVRDAKNVLKKISILNKTYNVYVSSIGKLLTKRTKQTANRSENHLKNNESIVYIHSLLQEEANKLVKNKPSNFAETFTGITKSKILLKRCFILFYIWMVILMVYLGKKILKFW